jgi:hypothetical protein
MLRSGLLSESFLFIDTTQQITLGEAFHSLLRRNGHWVGVSVIVGLVVVSSFFLLASRSADNSSSGGKYDPYVHQYHRYRLTLNPATWTDRQSCLNTFLSYLLKIQDEGHHIHKVQFDFQDPIIYVSRRRTLDTPDHLLRKKGYTWGINDRISGSVVNSSMDLKFQSPDPSIGRAKNIEPSFYQRLGSTQTFDQEFFFAGVDVPYYLTWFEHKVEVTQLPLKPQISVIQEGNPYFADFQFLVDLPGDTPVIQLNETYYWTIEYLHNEIAYNSLEWVLSLAYPSLESARQGNTAPLYAEFVIRFYAANHGIGGWDVDVLEYCLELFKAVIEEGNWAYVVHDPTWIYYQ